MTQSNARTVQYDGFTVTARIVDGALTVTSYTLDPSFSRQDLVACHGPDILTMTPAAFVTATPHREQVLRDAVQRDA